MAPVNNRRKCETIHKLEASKVFHSLGDDMFKTYAHHLAQACWHGGRIVLRQTSPEAEGIFDFIIELHRACNGRWDDFRERCLEQEDLDTWLQFAGSFLSNLGNYFVSVHYSLRAFEPWPELLMLRSQNDGDRKSTPNVPKDVLRRMAGISPNASAKLEEIIDRMTTAQPAQLGYPNKTNQSSYYPGKEWNTKEEIEAVTKLMDTNGIAPENPRLQKHSRGNALTSEDIDVFEIL
jgi:dipeptidyl-peptidase-3